MGRILIHFLNHLRKLDWMLVISTLLLVGVGLLSIYSSSLGGEDFLNFKKQIIFFVIGFFLMIAVSFFDWRILQSNPYIILIVYFLCLLALTGLFFFAPEIRGAKSWYRAGVVSFDPIEFTKIVLLVLLAKYFSIRHIEMYRIRHIILSGLYFLLPAILIFFQPNLGPVLILIFLWMGVLVISGIKTRHFLLLCFAGLLLLVFSWSFLLRDYQKERIANFITPQVEPLGIGWSQNQARIAIGSGNIFGQGFGNGSQTQYGFLPEPQTDFIFAAIAEEFGLIGVTILLILFLVFIWRCIRLSLTSQSNFPRFFSAGFAILLSAEFFVHIGMNLGLLPIIGIPLPLVSYGGSGLLATFLGLGLLQSIKAKA